MGIKHSRPVPPFMRYCSAIIPTMFDDSLSYYEALCALNRFIQKNLVEVVNNNATVTQEYIELTNQLKEYMENYFENLDVQVEINNKLDQMVETGEFDSLFAQYVDPRLDSYEATIDTRLDSFDRRITEVTNGTPIPVSSTSGMTDNTKIYLNTTDSKWYYWNGSAWTIGGNYLPSDIDDNSISPDKLTEGLRDSIGFQASGNTTAADTTKTYYIPYKISTNNSYKFNLTATGVSYINEHVIQVSTCASLEDTTNIDSIAFLDVDGTKNGILYPSSNAGYIKIKSHSYTECTYAFDIQKLIELNDISDLAKYSLGEPISVSKDYGSNTTWCYSYRYPFKAGKTYQVKITNTATQFIAAPTMKVGTGATSYSGYFPEYVDTIFTNNGASAVDTKVLFTPTTDANFLYVYVKNYQSGTFTVDVTESRFSVIDNDVTTVRKTARDNFNDYTSIASAVASGADSINILNGVFTESIGDRNSILPELVGYSNQTTVINNNSGNYSTPPIECAKCVLSNLKITETSSSDESNSYCLHIDNSAGANTTSVIENCNFEDNKYWCVGIGTYEGQVIEFRNCNFSNCERCIYMHNADGDYEGTAKLKFINCTFEASGNCIALQDYNGNGAVEFTFINCNVKSGTGNPVTIEYKNYGDGTAHDNTWAHKFSLASNSYGNNISLLNA